MRTPPLDRVLTSRPSVTCVSTPAIVDGADKDDDGIGVRPSGTEVSGQSQ